MRFLIVLMLLTSPIAAEQSIYLLEVSRHYNRDKDYNESQDIIGYESNGYFIETFKNSKNIRSWYAGYGKRDIYCFSDSVCLGGDAGLMYGYRFNDKAVTPVIIPMISWKVRKDIGVDFRFGWRKVIALRVRYIF